MSGTSSSSLSSDSFLSLLLSFPSGWPASFTGQEGHFRALRPASSLPGSEPVLRALAPNRVYHPFACVWQLVCAWAGTLYFLEVSMTLCSEQLSQISHNCLKEGEGWSQKTLVLVNRSDGPVLLPAGKCDVCGIVFKAGYQSFSVQSVCDSKSPGS